MTFQLTQWLGGQDSKLALENSQRFKSLIHRLGKKIIQTRLVVCMLVRKLEIDKQFVIYFFIEFRSVWCILPVRGAFL